jgi:hypothetical protein
MSLSGKSFRNTLTLVSIVLIISTFITAGVVACEALIKNVGENAEQTNLKDVADSSQANSYLYANSEQANYESVADCQKTNYKAVSDCQKTECNSFADKSSNPTNCIGTSSSTNSNCTPSSTNSNCTPSSTNSNCTPSSTNSNCTPSSTCYSTSCSKACNGASSTTGCRKSCTETYNSASCSKTCNGASSSTCYRTSCSKTCNGSSSNTSSSNTSSSSSVYISGFYIGSPSETQNQEWVQVSNQGTTAVNMQGWKITDEGAKHTYSFPYYVLNSGSTVTLYTGIGTDNGNILFWNSGSFIWNNDGDTAYLYNDQGQLVSTKTGTSSTTASTTSTTATAASATTSTAPTTESTTYTTSTPALNGTQFNTVASVPCNCTYSQAGNAFSTERSWKSRAHFTSNNTANYSTASEDVTINGLSGTQKISSDHSRNRYISSYNSLNQNGSYDQSNDIEFRKGRMWKHNQ